MRKNKLNRQVYRRNTSRMIQYTFAIIMAISMAFPFYWMIVTAMKTPQELSVFPPKLLPENFNIDNFIEVVERRAFLTYMKNSIIYSVLETALLLIITIFAAYGFHMMQSRFKKTIFLFLLLTGAIPFEVVMIFNYKLIIDWGLHNNLWALILPFVCNFSDVFVLYSAFNGIPKSLYYSAKLDKSSNANYLFRIALPYVRPTIIFICLMNMVGAWNSFLWPLLVTSSDAKRTLPIGIYSFIPENGSKTELVMAMSILSQIPMVLMYFLFQKHIKREKQ